MATITLHRKQRFKLALPYWIYVNGNLVGLMRSPSVSIAVPDGGYTIEVKIMFKVFRWMFGIGGRRKVTMRGDDHLHLCITDRERWWNILFDIDMVLWLLSFFITLPHPWSLVYHIVSDGFFALWILHIYLRRNRYFSILPK